MRRTKAVALRQHHAERVRAWVARGLVTGDGSDDWCDGMARRSEADIGTFVPKATVRAHAFAIRAAAAKAAAKGDTNG